MDDRPAGLETPAPGWFVLLDGSLGLLAVLALSPRVHAAGRRRIPLPPPWALRRLLLAALALHLAEGAVAGHLARRRGLAPGPWTVQTLIVGFPSLRKLRALGHPSPVS